MTSPDPHPTAPPDPTFLPRLRGMAWRGLARMYAPGEKRFVFRLRKADGGIVSEGLSPRYTAITLIGLATEPEAPAQEVLQGMTARGLAADLLREVPMMPNLGDVALTLWATAALGVEGRQAAVARLLELDPARATHPTVEVAWALSGVVEHGDPQLAPVRDALAARLVQALSTGNIFPHVLGGDDGGARAHVACFADMVYPIQALSRLKLATGDASGIDAALRAGDHICATQGDAGQWWWHYDRRTGAVIEGYPVYAVHQDAMAPMALLALQRASGRDYSAAIARGLSWLARSPELEGGSLVDDGADLIWRKVARREPGKATRYLQAAASAVHQGLRFPGTDALFPPGAIDFEDRPYHLGWLFHAFPGEPL